MFLPPPLILNKSIAYIENVSFRRHIKKHSVVNACNVIDKGNSQNSESSEIKNPNICDITKSIKSEESNSHASEAIVIENEEIKSNDKSKECCLVVSSTSLHKRWLRWNNTVSLSLSKFCLVLAIRTASFTKQFLISFISDGHWLLKYLNYISVWNSSPVKLF